MENWKYLSMAIQSVCATHSKRKLENETKTFPWRALDISMTHVSY